MADDLDIIVKTSFGKITTLKASKTTNIRDCKLLCELELSIPAEFQVLSYENCSILEDNQVISSTSPTDNTIILQMRVVTEMEELLSACLTYDKERIAQGIMDKMVGSPDDQAFVAAFIAAGHAKHEILNYLIQSQEWSIDVTKRTQISSRSLLHVAIAGGDVRCVACIMTTKGALDLLQNDDQNHETPLDLSRRLQKPKLVFFLESYVKTRNNMHRMEDHLQTIQQNRSSMHDLCTNRSAHRKNVAAQVPPSKTAVVNDNNHQDSNITTMDYKEEKPKSQKQRTRNPFRKVSLKLLLPPRDMQHINTSSLEASNTTKHQHIQTSKSHKTVVPQVKVAQEETIQEHHVNGGHLTTRFSQSTEHLQMLQRKQLGNARPGSAILPGTPLLSNNEGLCKGSTTPHPPDTRLSPKTSPIMQRRLGFQVVKDQKSVERSIPVSPSCKPSQMLSTPISIKQLQEPNFSVKSKSAPNSPQMSRKNTTHKINKELDEMHHRVHSLRIVIDGLNNRRGSLSIALENNNPTITMNRDVNNSVATNRRKSFDVWLSEKEQDATCKQALESQFQQIVHKVAEETWLEICTTGKTYEDWLQEKTVASRTDSSVECRNHVHQRHCLKKTLKFEEWLKKKDEEDLQKEKFIRHQAQKQFEEQRRKGENGKMLCRRSEKHRWSMH